MPAADSRPICVVGIGAGSTGMTCAIRLAELGFRVHGCDATPERLVRLRAGAPAAGEIGMTSALRKHLDTGALQFFDRIDDAAIDARVIIVTLPISWSDDGSADTSGLDGVLAELRHVSYSAWPTIVIQSPVPPGTSDRLAMFVQGWAELIYVPDFPAEQSLNPDVLDPSHIVVGCESLSAALEYLRLFESLHRPIIWTSRTSAELMKFCASAYVALNTSYANEVANLCAAFDAVADDVLRGISYDRRVSSPTALRSGIGFGKSSVESDLRQIHHLGARAGVATELLSATLRVNSAQPRRIVALIENAVGSLAGKAIGIWGLTRWGESADSAALSVIEELAERGAHMVIFDPAISVTVLPANCRLTTSALEAADSDALLVLTAWPSFADIDPLEYGPKVRSKVVVDASSLLDPDRLTAAGLTYRGIGRSASSASPRDPRRTSAVR